MIYLAISITNGCACCSARTGAAGRANDQGDVRRTSGIVGMANQTNKLADGYRVPVDERFENLF
jgi:hypothetical protein